MSKTYVSIEAVIQGSREEPIEFKCRSEKQALKLRATLATAPEMLEVLESVASHFKATGMSPEEHELNSMICRMINKATGGAE